MFYPAKFTPAEEGGFIVTFRDIPEAITQGDNMDDAHKMATDALLTAMDFYFEDSRSVPMPSEKKDDEEMIELPTSVFAKILLLNTMLEQNISNSELARLMGTRPQEVQRIVNLEHTTKIDTIVAALHKLGKNLFLQLQSR